MQVSVTQQPRFNSPNAPVGEGWLELNKVPNGTYYGGPALTRAYAILLQRA